MKTTLSLIAAALVLLAGQANAEKAPNQRRTTPPAQHTVRTQPPQRTVVMKDGSNNVTLENYSHQNPRKPNAITSNDALVTSNNTVADGKFGPTTEAHRTPHSNQTNTQNVVQGNYIGTNAVAPATGPNQVIAAELVTEDPHSVRGKVASPASSDVPTVSESSAVKAKGFMVEISGVNAGYIKAVPDATSQPQSLTDDFGGVPSNRAPPQSTSAD